MIFFFKKRLVLRVLDVEKFSITFSLKSGILQTISLYIESIVNAFNLSLHIVLRKKVFILFKVEKYLFASYVVIGVVIKICSSLVIFTNFYSIAISEKETLPGVRCRKTYSKKI